METNLRQIADSSQLSRPRSWHIGELGCNALWLNAYTDMDVKTKEGITHEKHVLKMVHVAA